MIWCCLKRATLEWSAWYLCPPSQVWCILTPLTHVNARGVLLGRPVELMMLDDKSDKETSIKLNEKLITQDKVDLPSAPHSSGIPYALHNVVEPSPFPCMVATCHVVL